MLNQNERAILKKIADSHLISKPELRKYVESNGFAMSDPAAAVESITRRLIEQKLVTAIAPVGSTCFIITQRGNQTLKELE